MGYPKFVTDFSDMIKWMDDLRQDCTKKRERIADLELKLSVMKEIKGIPDMVAVNLNDYIEFEIEEYGEKIWVDHYSEFNTDFRIPPSVKGKHKLQLWQYMAIFGKHMGNGFNNPTSLNVKIQVIR